jgi:hypothetical protein
MANMLDFFKGPKGQAPKQSVSVYSVGPIGKPNPPARGPAPNAQLPRAVAVYAAGCAIFTVLTLFYFIKGMWFTGLILIVPTFCLGGFAWYYLKASNNKLW